MLNTNQIQEQYLRNLSDCPYCWHPGRSLHSQPAPFSYGLQSTEGIKNTNIEVMSIDYIQYIRKDLHYMLEKG